MEGTGIGLALARELVQLMKGEIKADSEPGKGAVFTIKLPVTRVAVADQPVWKEQKGQGKQAESFEKVTLKSKAEAEKPIILVVEDSPDVATYIKACLSDQYEVRTATDGEAGLQSAFDLIPDLVISDVMMPKKDGFEVLQILKDDPRTSHIPVVLLTALADDTSRLAGLKHGANAYLWKPFLREELLIRVDQLLTERHRMEAYYLAKLGVGNADPELPLTKDQPTNDNFVLQLKEVIKEHMSDPKFNVEQLVQRLFLTPSTLRRKTKALTGKTPVELIRYIRLKQARLLLQNSTKSITEVSLETGFGSLEYFDRKFKEQFGLTPTEFRSQL